MAKAFLGNMRKRQGKTVQNISIDRLLRLPIFFSTICITTFLTACNSGSKSDAEFAIEKFNASWQSDSIPFLLRTREEVAALAPGSPEGFYCKAWILAKKSNLSKAIKTADSLVIGFPSFEKGWYLRANLKVEMNDTSGAFKDFQQCLKRNPNFFEAYINRGGLYFKSGNLDFALRDFESARNLSSGNKIVHLNLGNAYMALHQVDKACENWRKADSLGDLQAKNYSKLYCNLPR